MPQAQELGLYQKALAGTKDEKERLSLMEKINSLKAAIVKSTGAENVELRTQNELAGMTVEQLKAATAENQKQLGQLEKAKAAAAAINQVRQQGLQIQQAYGAAVKKQQDEENKLEEAKQASYNEGFSKQREQFIGELEATKGLYVKHFEDLDKGYADAQKKASDYSAQNVSLKKLEAAATDRANLMGQMMLLTDEQRVQALKKISNSVAGTSEQIQKQREETSKAWDDSTELYIAWNNIKGTNEQIVRDKFDMMKLDAGMISGGREMADIMNRHADLAERIKEEYGLTLEAAAGLSDKELDRLKNLKDIADNIAKAKTDYAIGAKFGIEGMAESALQQQYDALKEKFLASGGTDFGAYQGMNYIKGQQQAAEAKKKREDESKQLAETEYNDTKNALSSAIEIGMNEGAAKGIKGFIDQIKSKMQKQFADMIAEGLMRGGEQGGPGFFGAIMGNSTKGMFTQNAGGVNAMAAAGGMIPMNNPAITAMAGAAQASGAASMGVIGAGASPFIKGWGNLAAVATGGKQGALANIAGGAQQAGGFMGMLKGFFGGGGAAGAAGGGGGFMGLLGKASPYLMAASMIAGFLKKPPGAAQSGVAQLPQQTGIQNIGGGLDVLRGSSEFSRMSFSSRNMSGALTGRMAGIRMAGESEKVSVDINVKAGPMFQTEVKTKVGEAIKMSNAGGTPRRTGNEIG